MPLRLIFVGVALGLAWALRGHFGHEHGAAWAGSVGCMAGIIAAARKDWRERLPMASLVGGLGWGVGGIMSYGIIVGYGRGTDFLNVWYGLAMLGVVGMLYGFIGGAFFGLVLEARSDNRVQWPSLITEMVAGAVLAYGVLITQLGWKMTPPRSELWAACLGAAVMLGWHLKRCGFPASLRLAWFSGAGAGLGFALGNLLQTAGTSTGVAFNWWNVMEFTLGLCGGLGMAWGLFSNRWPEAEPLPSAGRRLSWFGLLVALPAINFIQAFATPRLLDQAHRLEATSPERLADLQQFSGGLLLAVLAVLAARFMARESGAGRPDLWLFWSSLVGYILMSHIRKAVPWVGFTGQFEQALYWVPAAGLAGLLLAFRSTKTEPWTVRTGLSGREAWLSVVVLILLAGAMALVSIHLHDGLPGAHERFPGLQ